MHSRTDLEESDSNRSGAAKIKYSEATTGDCMSCELSDHNTKQENRNMLCNMKNAIANTTNINVLAKILFSHKDDNDAFNVIYSTLLSMNNLIKIFPNNLLQIIAFCATGNLIECDGNCTNEILLLKSKEFLNDYKIYQSPHESIVKLCINCISNDDIASICQFCHNKYPSNLFDIVDLELNASEKGCIDCRFFWTEVSNSIEKFIVEYQDWASLTNGLVKKMLKKKYGIARLKLFKQMIKKRIQQVAESEIDRNNNIKQANVKVVQI